MNKAVRNVLCGIVIAVLLGGCATQEQTGAVAGGVVGAAVGSAVGEGEGRLAAIIVGTIAGSVIGAQIGRHMDEQDRIHVSKTLEYNRTGQPSQWRNPDSGHDYVVTPTRTYEAHGFPCREFTLNAAIGGKQEEVYGTACRQEDGSWRLVN